MKNIDIENLERRNIYKTPEGFFDDIQEKVLQETVKRKEGKVVKLSWFYAAAAAIALFFGINFIVNQQEAKQNHLTKTNISSLEKTDISKPQQSEAAIALQHLEEDLIASVPESKIKSKTQEIITDAVSVNQKETGTPEIQVEQILSNLTSNELADLGRNMEQDIYLDLFN